MVVVVVVVVVVLVEVEAVLELVSLFFFLKRPPTTGSLEASRKYALTRTTPTVAAIVEVFEQGIIRVGRGEGCEEEEGEEKKRRKRREEVKVSVRWKSRKVAKLKTRFVLFVDPRAP